MGRHRWMLAVFLFPIFLYALSQGSVSAQDSGSGTPPSAEQPLQKLIMAQSAMCEKVENLHPIRRSIAFSVSTGTVYCYTSFDPVPTPSVIYHRWFHNDRLSTQTRLRLYPPKWATYSVIQLRETDKGPWRVEVTDQNGHIFDILRFSITD